ncbi:MAG: potassium channel protein [Chitinophagaceae bacterium]|nr:potassium channel protein [Anaerolineae bacterium]
MDNIQDTRRQLRIAIIAISIIVVCGVIGFHIIEKLSWLDALWLTIITIATVGYGDIYARTPIGRAFTIFLLIFGLGTFAYAAQAAVTFFLSPEMRFSQQIRKAGKKINSLRGHYIICGAGELVDNTIDYLLLRVAMRREHEAEMHATTIKSNLRRFLGGTKYTHWLRRFLFKLILLASRLFKRPETLLDAIVVVTQKSAYARHLRENGVLVVEADPTSDQALRDAGIDHAQAAMVMLESDTESLMAVLTARSRNTDIYITAATLEEELSQKMVRVGANNVIAPFEVAAQFLANATLRPAVNDFFNDIMFDQKSGGFIVQIYLGEDSPWIGRRLLQLDLRGRFTAGVIGIRLEDGNYLYAPDENYILKEAEVVLIVTPVIYIALLQQDARRGDASTTQTAPTWQRLPTPPRPKVNQKQYSLMEAEASIREMSEHFVICGAGSVIRNVTDKIDPERPFVILTYAQDLASDLLKRGFRVIHGDPAHEATLRKAGVERALALMVSIEEDADSIVTILNARSMSKRLLITATANTDVMIPKLRRAGADRVVSPFRVAAQFVLLATTRPAVSDFLQYVLYNYQTGLETNELYMQEDSPWIGKSIEELLLERIFRAGVLGIRQPESKYIYAPPGSHIIQPNEILIVVNPITLGDELRSIAHGSTNKRPKTLRREDVLKTGLWV